MDDYYALKIEVKNLREFAFDELSRDYNLDGTTREIAWNLYEEMDSESTFREQIHWIVDMVIHRAKQQQGK